MSASIKSHQNKSWRKDSDAVVKSGLVSFLFLVFVRFLASIATSSSSTPNMLIVTSIHVVNESFKQLNTSISDFAGSSVPIWEKTISSTPEERVGATLGVKSNVKVLPGMLSVNFERNENKSASIRQHDDSSELEPSLLLSEDNATPPPPVIVPEKVLLVEKNIAAVQQHQQKQVSRFTMSRIVVPVMIELGALIIPGLPVIIRLLNHTRQGRRIKARVRILLSNVGKAGAKIVKQTMVVVDKYIFQIQHDNGTSKKRQPSL